MFELQTARTINTCLQNVPYLIDDTYYFVITGSSHLLQSQYMDMSMQQFTDPCSVPYEHALLHSLSMYRQFCVSSDQI